MIDLSEKTKIRSRSSRNSENCYERENYKIPDRQTYFIVLYINANFTHQRILKVHIDKENILDINPPFYVWTDKDKALRKMHR